MTVNARLGLPIYYIWWEVTWGKIDSFTAKNQSCFYNALSFMSEKYLILAFVDYFVCACLHVVYKEA